MKFLIIETADHQITDAAVGDASHYSDAVFMHQTKKGPRSAAHSSIVNVVELTRPHSLICCLVFLNIKGEVSVRQITYLEKARGLGIDGVVWTSPPSAEARKAIMPGLKLRRGQEFYAFTEDDRHLRLAADVIVWMKRIDPAAALKFAPHQYSLATAINASPAFRL